jgi:hypothetical protein
VTPAASTAAGVLWEGRKIQVVEPLANIDGFIRHKSPDVFVSIEYPI